MAEAVSRRQAFEGEGLSPDRGEARRKGGKRADRWKTSVTSGMDWTIYLACPDLVHCPNRNSVEFVARGTFSVSGAFPELFHVEQMPLSPLSSPSHVDCR